MNSNDNMNNINNNENNNESPLSIKVAEWAKNNSNYILIVGLLLINILIHMMIIEDGSLKLNDFSNYIWLDWVLFILFIIIPPVITILLRTTFQREGIKQSKNNYPDLVKEYVDLISNDPTMKVRSEKEFLSENAKRHTVKTFTITLVVSFLTTNLLLGVDATSAVRLAINSITSIIIGYLAFSESYQYGNDELKIWYKLEIKRLKDLDYDNMVKSRKHLGDGNGVT